MKALVVYSSITGNTKNIAETIYEALPFKKDFYRVDENFNLDKYDIIIIGYWVNKGSCDDNIKEIIETIHNKNILLFGTLGASDNGDYYRSVKKNIEALVSKDNKILGHFLCQGKINENLTQRYKEMLKKNPSDEHIKEQLKNHEEASNHPDNNDVENAKMFIKECIENKEY